MKKKKQYGRKIKQYGNRTDSRSSGNYPKLISLSPLILMNLTAIDTLILIYLE